ncbi:MAG: OmpH family outer membrane protein [Marinifilaceae bacterium]|jgi:outer membrane protein|nr:OmpH family outer membrane protein [Marinifilaceae bacterium]
MKQFLLTLALLLCTSIGFSQQRYGFVDTKYIMKKIPEFDSAQSQINKISMKWQLEIESIQSEIIKLNAKYKADEVFLSADLKTKRKNEIRLKEVQAQKLQQKYFGMNGELYKKRQELIQPIQDDIYNAIKEIAKTGNYAMILDKANGTQLIFCNPKFDLSDKVLFKLGIRSNK